MSFNHTTCGGCYNTYEFYGKHVPPCPRCGWPELKKTSEEYLKAMGVVPKPKPLPYKTWVCNECGAPEYLAIVSAEDVHKLGCSSCGASEWHIEERAYP